MSILNWIIYGLTIVFAIVGAVCMGRLVVYNFVHEDRKAYQLSLIVVGSILMSGLLNLILSATLCHNCGWNSISMLPPDHCSGCGTVITESSEQHNECACGATYDVSDNFCANCGKSLHIEEE